LFFDFLFAEERSRSFIASHLSPTILRSGSLASNIDSTCHLSIYEFVADLPRNACDVLILFNFSICHDVFDAVNFLPLSLLLVEPDAPDH